MAIFGSNINEATKRLDEAVDALETLLGPHLSDIEAGDSVNELKEHIKALAEERDQLASELEEARTRVRRLESANDEVSGRIESLMTSLKQDLTASPS
ncbi:DUF4164 family protein [Methyloligella halotolerans]|uniref:DUF4164 family protein n=1 Tax=Methyloligella halotolerans TaxID=1177755 RepID=UPI001472296A|nr:DUF4164 family protein [Methyloligella halotolerans]